MQNPVHCSINSVLTSEVQCQMVVDQQRKEKGIV